jgi:hypothetical protein
MLEHRLWFHYDVTRRVAKISGSAYEAFRSIGFLVFYGVTGRIQMPQKKHPLEIFKEHGTFAGYLKPKKKEKNLRNSGKTKKSISLFTRTKEKAENPGERIIALSLNNLLFCLIIVVSLSVCTYFLGYFKGSRNQGESQGVPLNETVDTGEETETDSSVQPYSNEKVTSGSSTRHEPRWGIQVGTWPKRNLEMAKRADAWLREKAYNSKICPLENREAYIIIVGSFLDRNDPELKRLERSLQAINDYPEGPKAPFKDAMVKKFYVKKKSKS